MSISLERLSGSRRLSSGRAKPDKTPSTTQSEGNGAPKTFDQYDPESRGCFIQELKLLGSSGRLFIQGERGLERAEPVQVKEHLDRGLPVELVTSYASESYTTSGRGASHSHRARGIFSAAYDHFQAGSQSEEVLKVIYGTSPFRSWDSLFFATPGEGVRGVAVLPPSGNSVTVSAQFEQSYLGISTEQWGFLEDNNFSRNSEGQTRRNVRPTA